MERNVNFLTKKLIAHRGWHDIKNGIPENSIIAFKKAMANNLIIELDVHVLKDGQVVVFHDENLKRMTGIDKNIREFVYEDLKKLRLNNTDEKIPLLKEVLELIDGIVPVIIELKYDVNKDQRFQHFLKDERDHPDYKKEKALFILHVNNWNKEHPEHPIDWADKVLPEPYSDQEILSIKNKS